MPESQSDPLIQRLDRLERENWYWKRATLSLLICIVAGPGVGHGEADDLALDVAHGTERKRQLTGSVVPEDHITGAAADPLPLASAVDRHRGPPFVYA